MNGRQKHIALITAIPGEQSFLPIHRQLQATVRQQFSITLDLFKNGEFCYFTDGRKQKLYYQQRPFAINKYSLVLVRFALKSAHGGDYYVLRMFENRGIRVVNSPQALVKAKDKLHTLQILLQSGLPVTPTAIVRTREQIKSALEILGPPPYIIKNCFGSKGRGVLQANTRSQVCAIFDYLWHLDRNQILLLQPYIENEPAWDVRALCINYKFWRAIARTARGGEFRTNIYMDANATPVNLHRDEQKMCEQAARALELPFAGVDFIRTARGPVILELNGCPGLEGLVVAYEQLRIDIVKELMQLLLGN